MQDNKSDEIKEQLHKLDNNFFKAFDECANALSLDELSRLTGIRIELLRRYVDRKVRHIRSETWDKIYPALKPYLEGPEPMKEPPPRIGAPYRRHSELVEMLSEQKVLLDEFSIFSDHEQKKIVKDFAGIVGEYVAPTEYSSLSQLENQLMAFYLTMPQETRDTTLADLTAKATAEVRRRRKQLF